MTVNKEDIEMIASSVLEAFDNMENLRCNTTGLFEYIKDCNEFFEEKKYEPERLCYSAIFLNEAQKRRIVLDKTQEQTMMTEAKLLALKYPEYNKEIHDFFNTAQSRN